jgi:NADH-quinone oxidoreductase subunit G
MPKLIIDDRPIEVAPKTMVIEAAAQLGIMIPRFCYHPALGPVGACRVCAVKFLEGPLKGLQMSCMVEAQDGMVVSTADAEAVDFRKHVIEWLMLNHPHDCPVCDEGGHCLLQDMTISGGHGIRRYAGRKRTYIDQNLGPLVQHEMNRCIHCYRCARFYQEFCGYRDLGVMCNANRTYFGRFQDGILQSPFAGNLSDICPTGVYTDKPSRFFGRRWDYQRSPSLCINCSLGCHTVASVRYREVKRQEACFSEAVNGYFICDRGRFGFFYAALESRPRQALINGEAVSPDRALQAALVKLAKISRDSGPSAIAAAGSARSSLETQARLKHLCRTRGWRNPVYFADPATTSKVNTAVARLEPELAVSLRQVEGADVILCLGADPINEAPMLALAMRQAHRNGAKVVVMDPRPVSLPFDFDHLAMAPDDMDRWIGSLIKAAVDRRTAASLGTKAAGFFDALAAGNLFDGFPADSVAATAAELKSSRQPVIVCGSDIVPLPVPGMAADLGLLLRAADKKAGVFYLLPGANAFGAGLICDDQASLLNVIEAIEGGEVKALVLAETDPFFDFADRSRLARAFDALELLIVVDFLDSESVQKAHIFMPSTTLFEMDAIFVNQQGRARMVRQAYRGGTPIVQSGGGDHPPRHYGTGIPGAAPRPAWMALADLAAEKPAPQENALAAPGHPWPANLAGQLAGLDASCGIADEGRRLDAGVQTDLRFGPDLSGSSGEQHTEGGARLRLILSDLTFGTEALSAHSECLRELEPQPAVFMHPRAAQDLGLADGDTVGIQTETGGFEALLKVADNMAAGVLVVPRHRKLNWQIFETGASSIGYEQIKKKAAD